MRVRAKDRFVLTPAKTGMPTVVYAGQPFSDDDELVREFPWAFEGDEVERATAAPGERRTVRRP